MGLHRLTDATIGVPDLAATARCYADSGLSPAATPSAAGPSRP